MGRAPRTMLSARDILFEVAVWAGARCQTGDAILQKAKVDVDAVIAGLDKWCAKNHNSVSALDSIGGNWTQKAHSSEVYLPRLNNNIIIIIMKTQSNNWFRVRSLTVVYWNQR